ncbi:MAG: hypothetical protein C9356_02810 [Oleiphilus sp.]|nr:MAG: hypothetical protein C9356_02810 [Oleiphilus sp.]
MDVFEICKAEISASISIREWSANFHEEVIVAGSTEPLEVTILDTLRKYLELVLGDVLDLELREKIHATHKHKIYRLVATNPANELASAMTAKIKSHCHQFFKKISNGQSDIFESNVISHLETDQMSLGDEQREACFETINAFQKTYHSPKKSLFFSLLDTEKISVTQIKKPETTSVKNVDKYFDHLFICGFDALKQEIYCKNDDNERIVLSAKRDAMAAKVLSLIDRAGRIDTVTLCVDPEKSSKKQIALIKCGTFIDASGTKIKL